MVVLVVQVLLGFQFNVVMERRFDRAVAAGTRRPPAGLALLLAAFALAVALATVHRLAEHGNDPRPSSSRWWEWAWRLLPIAAGRVRNHLRATRWLSESGVGLAHEPEVPDEPSDPRPKVLAMPARPVPDPAGPGSRCVHRSCIDNRWTFEDTRSPR